MPVTLDLTGLDNLLAGLRQIENLQPTTLILAWQAIIKEDNRKGVLAGLDKDGVPMVEVTYRPAPTLSLGKTYAKTRPYNPGVKGNLTSREYRRLGGPPLAPRGAGSRVITNMVTMQGHEGTTWYAIGYWDEVVSAKGNPFLHYHFTGAKLKRGGSLPRRDLRGLRPEGKAKARTALEAWAKDQIRIAFG